MNAYGLLVAFVGLFLLVTALRGRYYAIPAIGQSIAQAFTHPLPSSAGSASGTPAGGSGGGHLTSH